MAGISREERERRRLAAPPTQRGPSITIEAPPDAAAHAIDAAARAVARAVAEDIDNRYIAAAEAANAGKPESRHWPDFYYDPSDPEPEQSNMLGTKDPVWRAWFERNGGKVK